MMALLALLLRSVTPTTVSVDGLKTFSSIGKAEKNLTKAEETVLLQHVGKGALTHMWFGGDFPGWEKIKIRVYVDGEASASLDMEIFMGHGIGFADRLAPHVADKMGKTGSPSGVYNTFRIPFGTEVKVTAQLNADSPDHPSFWWIVRGTENLPVVIGGVQLPESARLKLHKVENKEFEPLVEVNMCDVQGKGALFLVTAAGQGLRAGTSWKELSFMEGCARAYINNGKDLMMLSSGTEDYFLGTYYFNKGKYMTNVAGLTHLDGQVNQYSAYRFHDEDPIFFQDGLRLTLRVGETEHGRPGEPVTGDPPRTRYTTYVWVYQW
jgi:hypothetical protein